MPTTWPEHDTLPFNEESKRTRLLPEEAASRRELVLRIVRSTTFARSKRLGSLLQHVCDLSLAGREAELNEHSIGHAVFGRARDYDSAVDGIVRSQASRLRQRLELYFEAEGADEPLLGLTHFCAARLISAIVDSRVWHG